MLAYQLSFWNYLELWTFHLKFFCRNIGGRNFFNSWIYGMHLKIFTLAFFCQKKTLLCLKGYSLLLAVVLRHEWIFCLFCFILNLYTWCIFYMKYAATGRNAHPYGIDQSNCFMRLFLQELHPLNSRKKSISLPQWWKGFSLIVFIRWLFLIPDREMLQEFSENQTTWSCDLLTKINNSGLWISRFRSFTSWEKNYNK